ncbi:MAG: hypothetical protein AABX71_02065 [Nanoarchaeota archaeon]
MSKEKREQKPSPLEFNPWTPEQVAQITGKKGTEFLRAHARHVRENDVYQARRRLEQGCPLYRGSVNVDALTVLYQPVDLPLPF